MKKSFNKFFDLLKSILVILIVLGFLSMIFGFMADIFGEADSTPDTSIGENDGNGSGGSGGNGSGGSGGSSDNEEPGENENPGGSGGSSGTVNPDIPNEPDEPEEPDKPDDPVQPGEPEDPDEPVNPDPEPDPDVPDVPEPEVHEHTFGGWYVVEDSTCTTDGLMKRECIDVDCDYYETEIISAGHKFNSSYVCTVCGFVDDSHHHTWSSWIIDVDSTCSMTGTKHKECECGAKDYVTIALKEHTITSWYTDPAPTCESSGLKWGVCTVCGHREETSVNALDHNYVNYICIRCGDVTDHNCQLGDWVYAPDATCTEYGNRHKYCTICGKVKLTEDIKPKGHTFVDHVCIICGHCEHLVEEWFIETSPTCYSFGIEYGFCVRCSERIERYLEHVDHEYGSDNFCKYCRQPFPDSEDDSKSYEETDETGTYVRNDIDVGYIYNGNMVIIGGCSVSNNGSNFPIEIMLTKPDIIKVRITVYFTHPVSENSVIIKSDSGEEFTPSLELSTDYSAVFEFEVDSSLVPVYHLTLYDLTGDGAIARVTGLVIDLYT